MQSINPPFVKIMKKDYPMIRVLDRLVKKHAVDSPDELEAKLTKGGKAMKPQHVKALGWWSKFTDAVKSVGKTAWSGLKDVGKEALSVVKPIVKKGAKTIISDIAASNPELAPLVPVAHQLIGDGKKVRKPRSLKGCGPVKSIKVRKMPLSEAASGSAHPSIPVRLQLKTARL